MVTLKHRCNRSMDAVLCLLFLGCYTSEYSAKQSVILGHKSPLGWCTIFGVGNDPSLLLSPLINTKEASKG
jgi:hypothetical protein